MQKRTPEFDGLRGIAVLMVIAFHYYALNHRADNNLGWILNVLMICNQGVDIFFVLSGFLIGRILIQTQGSAQFLSHFYLRRFARIAPPYALLLISALVTAAVIHPDHHRILSRALNHPLPTWVYLTLTQAIYQPIVLSIGSFWLTVTWSLSVEELYYLIAPQLTQRFSTRLILLLCASVILISPLLRILSELLLNNPFLSRYSFVCRADGLCMGFLTALLAHHSTPDKWLPRTKTRLAWTTVAIALSTCVFDYSRLSQQSPWHSLAPTFYGLQTSLIILLISSGGHRFLTAFLRIKILRGIGTVSYFCYLFHFPIYYLCYQWVSNWPVGMADNNEWQVLSLSLLLLFLCATTSWFFVERPLLRWSRGLNAVA